MRFNINEDVSVEMNFKLPQKMTQKDIFETYEYLLKNAEIVFDRKNEYRRVVMLDDTIGTDYFWFVSVVASNDKKHESMLFTRIKKEDFELNKKIVNEHFEKEEEIIRWKKILF